MGWQVEPNEPKTSRSCSFFVFMLGVIPTATNSFFYYPELHFQQHQLMIFHSNAAVPLFMGCDGV